MCPPGHVEIPGRACLKRTLVLPTPGNSYPVRGACEVPSRSMRQMAPRRVPLVMQDIHADAVVTHCRERHRLAVTVAAFKDHFLVGHLGSVLT
jgi:hypothetical protein